MREIASLAQAAYCPGQRALGASDSFGPAGNPARRPPEGVVGEAAAAWQCRLLLPFSRLKLSAGVARGLSFDAGELFEAVRARWPQPDRAGARGVTMALLLCRLANVAARLRPTGPWRRVLAGG